MHANGEAWKAAIVHRDLLEILCENYIDTAVDYLLFTLPPLFEL